MERQDSETYGWEGWEVKVLVGEGIMNIREKTQ